RPRVLHRAPRSDRGHRPRRRCRLLRAARVLAATGDRARTRARPHRGERIARGDAMKRALVILALFAGVAHAAPELTDYDPHSTAWNGMAQFVALAEGMGFEVTPVSELEWSDLTSKDILFLV